MNVSSSLEGAVFESHDVDGFIEVLRHGLSQGLVYLLDFGSRD
jgi:hypothetical protein